MLCEHKAERFFTCGCGMTCMFACLVVKVPITQP